MKYPIPHHKLKVYLLKGEFLVQLLLCLLPRPDRGVRAVLSCLHTLLWKGGSSKIKRLQVFVQWVMCCWHTEVYSLTSRARCTISLKHQDMHRKYMQKSRLPAGNLTSCDLEPKFGIKNKHFRMHIRTLKTRALAFKVTISSWIRNEP